MSAPPLPRNPRRMAWSEVPDAVVAAISERAGSAVESVDASVLGFSPGFAGVVRFEDGTRLFVKVMSAARDPWSIHLNRREADVLALLPAQVSAAALLWTLEQGEWFVIATEAVDGEHPVPGDPRHAAQVWSAFTELGQVRAPRELPPFHEHFEGLFTRWRTFADAPDLDQRLDLLGEDGEWVRANLSRLVRWEGDGIEASKGDCLVHGDLRADNMLLTEAGAVIVDWPWATHGAAWLDLAGFMPSHEMHGGGACSAEFRAHPLSRGVPPSEERSMVAVLAGYFTVTSTEPPVDALPGLREFQRAQALPALRWLRDVADLA